MDDGGVGQEALHLPLGDGHHGAHEDGHEAHRHEEEHPLLREHLARAEGRQEDADGPRRRGGLAAHGHEGGDGRGRALVDVGRPEVEGDERQLEEEPHQEEEEPEHEQGLAQAVGPRSQRRRQAAVVQGAGAAVEQGRAEEEEGRREGPQQEVLQGRLHGVLLGPEEAGQDVEGDGHGLEAQVEGDEVGGRGEHHHPRDGDGHEAVEFAPLDALLGEVVQREGGRKDGREDEERVEEEREGVRREERLRDDLPALGPQERHGAAAEEREGEEAEDAHGAAVLHHDGQQEEQAGRQAHPRHRKHAQKKLVHAIPSRSAQRPGSDPGGLLT